MFPRVMAIVASSVLLSAACSSGSTAGPVTSTVAPETSQEPESVTQAEIEADIERFVAEIPDETVRASIEDALGYAERVAGPCASPTTWSSAADDAAAALSDAAATVEVSTSLQDWKGTDVAVGIASNFVKILVVDPVCPGGEQSELDTVWSSAIGVLGALDEIFNAVHPAENGRASSPFWLNGDVLGHTVEVQRLVAEGESIDVLVTGDSTVKHGIDPVALGSALDQSVVNVSVNGLLPDGVSPWLHDLRTLGASPDVVVIGVSPYSSFIPCDGLRTVLYDVSVRQREEAFAGIDLLAGMEPQKRASGGAILAAGGPLIEEYEARFAERGRLIDPSEPVDEALLEGQRRVYSTLMSANEMCEARLELFGTQLAEFKSSGVDVVVMAMPVSEEMASMHPDGRAGQAELADDYERVASESGATFLRFTDLLADDEFVDLAHPNAAGRATLTQALSNELAQLN